MGALIAILAAEPCGPDADGAVRAALRAELTAHGGRALPTTDEGVVAAFDSVVAAVGCAIALLRLGPPLRAGVDAGEASADGEGLRGGPVVIAARLRDAAEDRELLVSDVVRQLVAGRIPEPAAATGVRRLRGVTEPVAVARIEWDGAAAFAPEEPERAPITVVIADDQQLVRAGFRVILDAEPDMRVVGEAADGRAAVDVVLRRRPDVVLMDIRMPELDGLSAAERILGDAERRTAVVMLTTFDQSDYVFRALKVGASGFLLKDTPAARLIDAVRVAAAGDALIAPSITRRLIGDLTRTRRADGVPPELSELTAREGEVLRLVARGLSNAEIAAELVLGENTVKTHVARMLGKLGLRDRVQAVVFAYETGIAAE